MQFHVFRCDISIQAFIVRRPHSPSILSSFLFRPHAFPFLNISSLIFRPFLLAFPYMRETYTCVFILFVSVTCCPTAPAISPQMKGLFAASCCCVHPWDPTFSWRSSHTIVEFRYLHESSLLVYYLAATFMQRGAILPSFASLHPSCLAQEVAPCRWLSHSCWLKTPSNRRYGLILFCLKESVFLVLKSSPFGLNFTQESTKWVTCWWPQCWLRVHNGRSLRSSVSHAELSPWNCPAR